MTLRSLKDAFHCVHGIIHVNQAGFMIYDLRFATFQWLSAIGDWPITAGSWSPGAIEIIVHLASCRVGDRRSACAAPWME